MPGMPSLAKRSFYVCQLCGLQAPKWMGRCSGCGEWDSLIEERAAAASTPLQETSDDLLSYTDLDSSDSPRIATGNAEFDRVLGGGLVPGGLILLGGEPGIGKSTLVLQVADGLAHSGRKVLYLAGEESPQQIRLRGERLAVNGKALFLATDTRLESILSQAATLKPDLLIIDSIQTVHSSRLESIPGSVSQIRECAALFMEFAKKHHLPILLIGHINKEGALAGPKMLEHVVDVVLYFEGERHQNQKIVRTVKNRFGPINELGIFEMTGTGLVAIENPSRLFLAERALDVPGSVVVCSLEGSRPVLVEMQALVSRSRYSTARRMCSGVDPNRVSLLLAMLEKRLGLELLGTDVYVNVAGGLSLLEPAADLAILASMLSSLRERPVDPRTVVFGEVGLAGEIRAVNRALVRIKEAATLGFTRALLPKSNLPLSENHEGIQLIGVSSVSDFLRALDRDSPEILE